MNAQGLHDCLDSYPGVALELSPDGVVVASNGHLDALIGRGVTGLALVELLNSASYEKLQQILDDTKRGNPACTWDLVFEKAESLELRTFLAVRSRKDSHGSLWLLEHSPDPKLELLYGELSELNGELVDAQRALARERARLADALERARSALRTRDEVLAVVSHDLRNPLNTIITSAALLGMDLPEEKKAVQVQVIRRVAARMGRLVGDLLDASAIESGSLSLELRQTDVRELLTGICATFAERARNGGRTLTTRIADDLPVIRIDAFRIEQVVANLLDNGLKFTDEGDTVTVRADVDGPALVIGVEDTGRGIPQQDLERIFERFWHTLRANRDGTGLGLFISRAIVQAHGGELTATSERGSGSTFVIRLPVTATDPSEGYEDAV